MRKLLAVVLTLVLTTNWVSGEEPRETSKRLEMTENGPSYYVKPAAVQAGHTPRFVGEVFVPPHERYPGLLKLRDPALLQMANELSYIEYDVSKRIGSYLPASWEAIIGVPLAYVREDLLDAGYSGGSQDAMSGLLDIFRIELVTPEHTTTFPTELLLHAEFRKGDVSEIVYFELVSDLRDGVYRHKSNDEAFMKLNEISGSFGELRGFYDTPIKMALTKLTGFDTDGISDLPPIKGAMLVHHIYIGSYRVVSGWQWIGRPPGLYESQQLGFVQ